VPSKRGILLLKLGKELIRRKKVMDRSSLENYMGYLLSNPHPLPAPSATRAAAASRGTKTAKKDVDRGINHCILVYYSTSTYLYVRVLFCMKNNSFYIVKNNYARNFHKTSMKKSFSLHI
jgi:hypothetical protein